MFLFYSTPVLLWVYCSASSTAPTDMLVQGVMSANNVGVDVWKQMAHLGVPKSDDAACPAHSEDCFMFMKLMHQSNVQKTPGEHL